MTTTYVESIGELALAFEEDKVIILYGSNAPKELKDVAVIHNGIEDQGFTLEEGKTFSIDDQTYELHAVGSSATQNFLELGHISIYFTESDGDMLPGAIYVTPHVYPSIKVGSVIKFHD